MVFKFESRAEATALLKRRSRDAAVAMLNKEFTAQRWTLRKELKLSVRPLVTLRYFRRAVGAVRAPAPGARELCAGGAVVLVAYAVALVARGAVGARAAGHAARALAAASYCLWWFVCGVLSTAGLGTGMQTGALFLFPHCARLATDWRRLGPASATTRALADRWLAKGAPAEDAGRPAGGDASPGASEAPAARAAPAASSFLGGLRRGAGGVSLGAARGGEAAAARDAASFRARSRDGRAALALRAAVPGFFSGAGSAVGELVPFFLARAARRAGADPFAVIEEEEAAADDEAPARRPRLPLLAARTRARASRRRSRTARSGRSSSSRPCRTRSSICAASCAARSTCRWARISARASPPRRSSGRRSRRVPSRSPCTASAARRRRRGPSAASPAAPSWPCRRSCSRASSSARSSRWRSSAP